METHIAHRSFYEEDLFILIFQLLFSGPLLSSSQGFSGEPNSYSHFNQIENSSTLHNTPSELLYIMTHDENIDTEAVLTLCEKSILGVVDDKAYINPNKLLNYKDHYLLLNDHHQ